MEYIYIGKIVNTHGIKGEIRIQSDLEEDIFKKGNTIYIGKPKEEFEINSFIVHKKYNMVTLKGINDINDVLKYKGLNVYVLKDNFKNKIFDEDLIGLEVCSTHLLGKVTSIETNKSYKMLRINNKYLIPYIDEFIESINISDNKIVVKNIEGLINED